MTVRATLGAGVARTLELRLPDEMPEALAHATKRPGTFTLTAGARVQIKAPLKRTAGSRLVTGRSPG